MKPLMAALLLALLTVPAMAADGVNTALVENHAPHPFSVRDLVMMDRVSDPQLSPDGRYAAFGVRSTDYAANRGVNAVYVLDLSRTTDQPVKVVDQGGSAPVRSTDGELDWLADTTEHFHQGINGEFGRFLVDHVGYAGP